MNSKNVFRLTVSYSELFNRCPPEQLRYAKALQANHKRYKKRLHELPEEPPKIDWDYYKTKVRPEYITIVEEFEKKYNEFKVPYPENPYVQQLEELTKVVEEDIRAFKEESNKRIRQIEDDIVLTCCEIPFDQMTMEEFCEYYPDVAPDFINRPTFWPHTPEEQIPGPSDPNYAKKMHKEKEEIEDDHKETSNMESEKKTEVSKKVLKKENKKDTNSNIENDKIDNKNKLEKGKLESDASKPTKAPKDKKN